MGGSGWPETKKVGNGVIKISVTGGREKTRKKVFAVRVNILLKHE